MMQQMCLFVIKLFQFKHNIDILCVRISCNNFVNVPKTCIKTYEVRHYKMGQMSLNIKDSKIEPKHKYI